MPSLVAHYRKKLREIGIRKLAVGRWHWYKQSFQIDNWLIGRLVELFGNTVTVDGVTLSVDNPLIPTQEKSTLYFGMHEAGERELSKRYIDPTLPVVEIGASIGGVACLTNRLLAEPSNHVVVECNPFVLPTLERNRDVNRCQFTIEPYALAYRSDTITLTVPSGGFLTANLYGNNLYRGTGREFTVRTITIKQILEKHHFQIVNLISDCEGGEVEMVECEGDVLRDRVKLMILETHELERGHAAITKTLLRLEELGFNIVCKDDKQSVFALVNRHLT